MKNSIMKKKIMAIAASAVMSVSAVAGTVGTAAAPLLGSMTNAVAAEASVKINATVGYAEGMYATWGAVSGATGYNVYVDGVQIDSMLIRQYSGYMRADAVGLKAGSHTMKIVPVINGKEDSSKAASGTASVYAHDRSGYAFADGHIPGAYKADGTLKDNAIVVYVTEATKDTVTASLNAEGKGNVECKGIQNIVTAYKKGKETRPISIRIIGNITDPGNMPKGDLMVDTVTSAGMTIEGIGSDATANGWGIVLKNCVDVEIRNIGTMNCNSDEGDNIGLQQGDSYCWVHNCDYFYGDAGSDADQVKGDGALDTKKSHHITHSYNHFYDNGKCNLQGANSSDTSNYITYHHNWYDHSDSRHPRVRVATVHVYNNYYDGNAKYGIGSTTDSDIFAENNYFRNCSKPMMISGQGTDAAGEGTFSGETGGMIKAYGNVFQGGTYVPYSSDNTQFDFYDAKSRTETVPSSVKAANGGAGYNNFDTAGDFYSYSVDAAEDVPAIVTAKAGRVDGGDFKWDFDDAKEDTNYAVIPELKSALVAYKDSIVSIGSGFKEDVSNPPTTTPSQTQPTTPAQTTPVQTTPPTNPGVTGGQIHNFTENEMSSSFYTITGNMNSKPTAITYNGMTLSKCMKMESATSVSFTAGSSGLLTLVTDGASKSIKVDGDKYIIDADGTLTLDIGAGAHTITKGDSMNLYYIAFGGEGGTPVVTAPPVTTQGGNTPVVTTVTTPAPVVPSGNISVVYAGGWNEMAYLVCSGIKDANVTGVSYSGAASGKLTGDDLEYLVRDVDEGVRVDLLGLKPGTYSITLETTAGKVTQPGIVVGQQDRSGYAHFNYSDGVGAYNDDGTLKEGAKVLYITNGNKDTVSVTSKDGTTVTGIGNILNSAGMDSGNGKTANGGTANSNAGIMKKIAEDGTPLVIRIVGNVEAPKGVTEFDSANYGGSVGDNGGMARIKSGKNITIEGVGNDACVNGWGFHFMAESAAPALGKSFEVRNIAFRNVPEDCIGMEGVQEGTGDSAKLTASVERCWIHNCEFYVPKIANPAESDKAEGDGACDFKRGQYFTNSYCYYEGYHKTNLVGASDSNIQYNISFHHNYWKNCESRGPLARQANIHMYNNVFDGQTSYCQNPRANSYIFSEYNAFVNECKNPGVVTSGGVIKSWNDAFISLKKDAKQEATVVSSKTEKVSSANKYAGFELDSSLSYIPSGAYVLSEKTGDALYTELNGVFEELGGCMDNKKLTTTPPVTQPAQTTEKPPVTTSPQPVVTTTAAPISSGVAGDANNDGTVDIADATLILQSIGNSDKYALSAAGLANADVVEPKGITALDSLEIQKYDAKVIDKLTSLS
ncbi:MAG: hypothetical protein J6K77_02395 [Ruminococcus sp.]|nr:hypothetical protein [Ruminococcus sp.]